MTMANPVMEHFFDGDWTVVLTLVDAQSGPAKSESQRSRQHKRKMMANALSQTREELFAGEFDGCG